MTSDTRKRSDDTVEPTHSRLHPPAGAVEDARCEEVSRLPLLPKTHRILERPFMEFRPFGRDVDGRMIRDMTGVSIRSNVEYLQEYIAGKRGPDAGEQAVQDLVRRLNERIPDRAYHVTPGLLKNPWTSYSNEFTAYLVEFCVDLSGDPDFQFKMGREKLIPPLMQTLMRPFSVKQIYHGATLWIRHYAKDSYDLEGLEVGDGSALLRMTLMSRALHQFGPYRRACARIWCNALKVGISIVPEKVHHLSAAMMTERRCIVEGDDCCEWDVRWAEPKRWYPGRRIVTIMAAHILRDEIGGRERVIEEQTRSLLVRHEELERAYVEVQRTAVELQRRVDHLTTLYEAGLTVTSARDRDGLISQALDILIQKLGYDRVMIASYDPLRQVTYGARLLGVSGEVAAFAEQLEVPVTDPGSIEGMVLLEGRPLLVPNLQDVLDQLHPLHRALAAKTGTRCFVSVPLKAKGWIIGALTVDRSRPDSLTPEDLELIVTFSNQLAIALDNVTAYREIEELNTGLEEKVRLRTTQLEALNDRLQEANELKSTFVSVVSHELRTPMTSIRSFVENMLDGMTGPLNDKQTTYLKRMLFNIDRLARLIVDLLDISRIEAGHIELRMQSLAMAEVVNDIVEGLRSLAAAKSVMLEVRHPPEAPSVRADRDHLTQILTNLIGNAVKFTPAGGTIEVRTAVADAGMVQVSVCDTGCGIAPDDLPRVFDKFFRGSAILREARGAGLGLAIAKSLVELHGGRIWVESIQGSGSSFSFTIPCTPSGESHTGGGEPERGAI